MFNVDLIRASFGNPKALVVAILISLACLNPTAPYQNDLTEADRLAWLTDWYSAYPLYARAERAANTAGDKRNALYAKFGRLRGEMQTLSLPDVSETIANDLDSALAQNDAALRLRGLTVKGDIDLEWDVDAAYNDWVAVQQLARQLSHDGWENRTKGELGMIAFLKGNTGDAGKLVETALQTAVKTGDVGGQLRYMGAVANGLLSAGFPQGALSFADRALAFSQQHPEAGFPFVVYSTKVMTHLRLNQPDEAERFARAAIDQARTGDRRIKETELLLMLATIAQQRGQNVQALDYQEKAVQLARVGHVRRLLGDAEHDLAEAYRQRGDFDRAEKHARAAVEETQDTGNRFNLPGRLQVLATIYAARGKTVEADQAFQQASDVVEGIMINVPTPAAQARLIGVMSNIYLDHFALAAKTLHAPSKAFSIIERARGRALADVLRTSSRPQSTPEGIKQSRAISQLQVQLMRARSAGTRRDLLDRIEMLENSLVPDSRRRPSLATANRVDIRRVHAALRPNEVMLEYVLSEPSSFCLVITDRALSVKSLSALKDITGLVDQYVTAVKSGSNTDTAKPLYKALIEPLAIPAPTQRIVVVPDGRLNLLPFDQLFTDNGQGNQIVSVAPSASVFALLRAPSASPQQQARPLLAIGDVPYDRPTPSSTTTSATRGAEPLGLYDVSAPPKLAVLPAARSELDAAANALGAESVVLAGDQATESLLKAQDLRSFRALHFAVHGVADQKNPERAALVLLSDAAAGEDGLLQPREISRFRLTASVVVLSACETAVGPTIGQEGVLNIARAFLLAGAKSVVTTYWTVSDDISTALMKQFYTNIASGLDVAQSLAAAKRTTVQRFGPPAVPTVAAFQVVGVGDSTLATSPLRSAR
jgi:CHAT domain-containing protein